MEFLLEINTEEMPASHVKSALFQLENKFKQELSAQEVEIIKLRTCGSCRRLVLVADLAPFQRERKIEVTGPPKVIAFLKNGSPSPAARGFAKSQGVSVDELEIIKTEKGEYVGLKKVEQGKTTQEILAEIIPQIIPSLSFPKMMRWGEELFKFSRPIKNIMSVFGGNLLSFIVGGISSTDFTFGHKIHSPQKIKVKSFADYRDLLLNNKVVIEPEERRKIILNLIEKNLASLEAQILYDEQLLQKLIYDVEYPYVFLGSFPKQYLSLPLEVLSTALKEGQSLFSVVKGKKQLPYFLGVADNYKDTRELIKRGNERVLKARLEDAKFFWQQDLKTPLKKRVSSLKKIIFQEKLGSYEEKAARLRKIVAYLADRLSQKKIKSDLIQAAELAKVDLLTEMVREFPSLQGKIGGLYAQKEGYPSTVWKAIYEHYQPLSLEESSPLTLAGALLSIADKLDSVVGVIGLGIEVSGSRDPFGLRRNSQGVCKIILEKKLNFSFSRLLDKVIKVYGDRLKKDKNETKEYCHNFFTSRLQYIYEKQGYRYDLVKAALKADADNIYYSSLRVKALDSLKNSAHFEPMILIAKRVNNILGQQPRYRIVPDLFIEKEEKALYTTYSIINKNVQPLISQGDFLRAQRFIFRMRATIDDFFDNVLVMTEDKRLRRNRLALLQAISKLFLQIADYSQIVVEG